MKSAATLLLLAGAFAGVDAGKTSSPTLFPTTAAPTLQPTTAAPTLEPTTAAPTTTDAPTMATDAPTNVVTAAPTGNGTANATSSPTGTVVPTPAPTKPYTTIPNGLVGNTYNGPEVRDVPHTFVGPCYKQYYFSGVSVQVSLMCAGRNVTMAPSMDNSTTMAPTMDANATTMAPTAGSNSTNGTTMAPTRTPAAVPVWTVTVDTKTVSCGQNVQVGTLGGVMGGPAKLWTAAEAMSGLTPPPHKDVVVCAAYNAVSEPWAGIQPTPALLMMNFWVQPQPSNATSSAVYCATQMPTEQQRTREKYPEIDIVTWASGPAKCVSGACKNDPLNIITCIGGQQQVWFDQGVGMSVGGVGMILVTIAAILLAGRFTTSM